MSWSAFEHRSLVDRAKLHAPPQLRANVEVCRREVVADQEEARLGILVDARRAVPADQLRGQVGNAGAEHLEARFRGGGSESGQGDFQTLAAFGKHD